MQMSLLSRERGLKFEPLWHGCAQINVAPFAGAWIEMSAAKSALQASPRRSLHGSVD